MEYLVEFHINVPEGTPAGRGFGPGAGRGGRRSTNWRPRVIWYGFGSGLLQQAKPTRLACTWPTARPSWTLCSGRYRSTSGWSVTVTPLERHPNDPARRRSAARRNRL